MQRKGSVGLPRESDRNANKFHKGHYEIIAARFREQMSRYLDDNGQPVNTAGCYKADALEELARSLSDRFKFDNEEHDTAIFLERCGVVAS